MILIYTIICLLFALIAKPSHIYGGWVINWAICLAFTPILGVPINYIIWKNF